MNNSLSTPAFLNPAVHELLYHWLAGIRGCADELPVAQLDLLAHREEQAHVPSSLLSFLTISAMAGVPHRPLLPSYM